MRLCILTSNPLNIVEGSGTFAGIHALAEGLRRLGVQVNILAPEKRLFNYTARRFAFNRSLARRVTELSPDAVVGIDMDGYRLPPGSWKYAVAIKGVITDELQHERGVTRLLMRLQSACEKQNIHRAQMVFAPSHYSARKIEEFYGYPAHLVRIVPEAIDLGRWRALLAECPVTATDRFTALTVCRFYPRKQLEVLIRAIALVPGVGVRIVGDGPQRVRWQRLARRLGLEDRLHWLGNVSQAALAREYGRTGAFCLPSVQEAFGIVFLEAMAAGKPVIAARAAAAPEVVRDGEEALLVEPLDPFALAGALRRLRDEPRLRTELGLRGLRRVEEFDYMKVSAQFLSALTGIPPR